MEMKDNILNGFEEYNINSYIRTRIKSIYGIYKEQNKYFKDGVDFNITNIHDLFSLKINVDNIDDCYRALRIVHFKYTPVNNKFKDYICRSKTNKYQSLHTTVYGFDDNLVQTQIRTFEMDRIADHGITEYWNRRGEDTREIMQQELKKYQFYDSLLEIDKCFGSDQEFVNQIKNELFYNKVYTYNMANGEIIELPVGSTIVDFAYRVGSGNNMIAAEVNGKNVDLDYILKKGDKVKIVTNDLISNVSVNWQDIVKTTYARSRIKRSNTFGNSKAL